MGQCCTKFLRKDDKEEPLNIREVDKYFEKDKQNKTANTISKEPNIISKEVSIKDFQIKKVIGRGSFGKVLLVRYILDSRLYAMKILKKDVISQLNQINHTKTEREILARVDHEFIVKLKFAFQTVEKLYLVTDFMQGGELFYHLHKESRFDEDKIRFYVCEIILAIEYLHKRQVIYRDLKPENILLDAYGHVKLTDFGLSKFVFSNNNNKAFTICGTPEYLAPEILTGKGYDKAVDWWSLGCLTYEMLCGESPFKFKNKIKLDDVSIYDRKVEFPSHIRQDTKNFVVSLLQVEPSKRLGSGKNDAENLKIHPFFSGVNWVDVEKKNITVPFVPILNSSDDLVYFDKLFTEEDPTDTIIENSLLQTRGKNEDDYNYDKFTYINQSSIHLCNK